MPDTVKPSEGDKPPEGTPTPSFVPADEFKRFQETITGTLGTLNETIGALKGSIDVIAATRSAGQAPPENVITEEQFDSAVQTGDAKVIRAYMKQERDRMRREEIDPLRAQGVEAISTLSEEMATGKLKHYVRFKKQIDEHLSQLAPAARMNPKVIKAVHDAIIGQHMDVLLGEAKEEALRQATQSSTPGAPKPGQVSGRETGDTKVPTVAELFGQEAADALEGVGRTPDEHARNLGHKDWPTFAAFVQKQRAGEPEPAAAGRK